MNGDLKKCLETLESTLRELTEELRRIDRDVRERVDAKASVVKALEARLVDLEQRPAPEVSPRRIREIRVIYDDGTEEIT